MPHTRTHAEELEHDQEIIEKTSVFKDPRVDKLVSWVLAAFVTVALSVSVSAFRSLAEDMRALRRAVEVLNTRVSVLETSGSRIEEHMAYRVERVEVKLEKFELKLDRLQTELLKTEAAQGRLPKDK